MSWMPSSGAPVATGGWELPGSPPPAFSRDRCRYSHDCRPGPTEASMPSPISVANRPWPTGITPSAAARATWSGRAGGEGAMLDAVAGVTARVTSGRGVERVQGEVDRAVADRVRGDPPAGLVRCDDHFGEGAGVALQVAAVARLTVVGGGHGGGAADERPVGEDLHRPEAHPVVAEGGAQAPVE